VVIRGAMYKTQEPTPQITCEDIIYAGQDDEIADLWEIVHDVINTRGAMHVDGIKQWLPAYTGHNDLKDALHPELFNAVIKHAIAQR